MFERSIKRVSAMVGVLILANAAAAQTQSTLPAAAGKLEAIHFSQERLPASAKPQPGDIVLSVYGPVPELGRLIARPASPSGREPPGGSPPGQFLGLGIDNSSTVVANLLDPKGEVVGFITELVTDTQTDAQGIHTANKQLIFSFPGRGFIYATQTDSYDRANEKLAPSNTRPVILVTSGPLPNNRARILGGTGVFAGVTGSLQQYYNLGVGAGSKPTQEVEFRLFLQ